MQLFDADATRALLPGAELVEAVADAMRARRDGRLQAPERLALPLPDGASWLAMPAADDTLAIAKLVAVHPANRARGLPTIHGQVLVSDARDGRPLMLLDGPTVTARRTAAVTALGLRTLARKPLRAIALVGTGVQALEHARLLAEVAGVGTLRIVGRSEAQATAFAERLAAELPRLRLHVDRTIDAALPHIDAVVTLTTSTAPVLPEAVPAHVVAVGVGAFTPRMAELPPALLRTRRVVVDALDGARREAGDLLQAGIDWDRVTELADHLDAAVPEAERAGPAPVFKTVGQAAWDLAAARVAHRIAVPSPSSARERATAP